MKRKIINFILFLMMTALLIVLIFIGCLIYLNIVSDDSKQVVYNLQDIAVEEPTEEKEKKENTQDTKNIGDAIQSIFNSNSNTNDNTYTPNENISQSYFYNQLNESEKIIYNGLQSNKDNLKQGTYVINFGNQFTDILSDEGGGDLLGNYYQTAIEAFTHDNPDLFYLDVNKMYLNIETTTKILKTTYNVYISPSKSQTYLLDEFSDSDQIKEIELAIEKVKNEVLSNLKGNDYQNILYIHDYLVDSIEYDSTYNATGSYGLYGALITKKCVCEGYAKAFKFLANAAGYECEIMQGKATNSSGNTENHAWNCVNINGTWYLVDTTWDDPIIVGKGKITKKIRYKYFLKGTDTFNKDHTLSYKFSEEGKEFSYPTISREDY